MKIGVDKETKTFKENKPFYEFKHVTIKTKDIHP